MSIIHNPLVFSSLEELYHHLERTVNENTPIIEYRLTGTHNISGIHLIREVRLSSIADPIPTNPRHLAEMLQQYYDSYIQAVGGLEKALETSFFTHLLAIQIIFSNPDSPDAFCGYEAFCASMREEQAQGGLNLLQTACAEFSETPATLDQVEVAYGNPRIQALFQRMVGSPPPSL